MKRDILQHLHLWREHPHRKPLILRGARQVGKSWVVKELGKQFSNFVTINFEQERQAQNIFTGNLEAHALLGKLSLYTHQKIIPGETLLFFDEIQECPDSLRALR